MADRCMWMAALPASVAVALAGPAASAVLIQGVIDGDLPDGLPKAIVLQATSLGNAELPLMRL